MTPEQIRPLVLSEAPPFTPLQCALLRANVPCPLDPDDVRTYQRQKWKEEKAKLMAGAKRNPWWALGTIPTWGLAARLVSLMLQLPSAMSPEMIVLGLAVGVMAFIGVCFVILSLEEIGTPESALGRRLEWRTYEVGRCSGTRWTNEGMYRTFHGPGLQTTTVIPELLIDRMKALRKTGVDAIFEVQQLDVDPFLWVVSGRERYCIGVWDEKGFIQ